MPIISAIFGPHATQMVLKRHLWGTPPFGEPCVLLQSANCSFRVRKCSFRGALSCVRCFACHSGDVLQVFRQQHGQGSAAWGGRQLLQHAVACHIRIPLAFALRGARLLVFAICGCRDHYCKALPTCKCTPDSPLAAGEQPIVWRDGNTVCIRMLRRKNRQHGSGVLKRVCTCKGDPLMCVVHTLWDKFLATLPDGARPWEHISAGTARTRLHRILDVLKVPSAKCFGTHDFRRGHAEDMRLSGCTLAEILAAGQWKSTAFLRYINEARVVLLLSALREMSGHVRQTWKKTSP